tara:strand:+ start:189 stop:602 length:414 start_codon:yes stop_codon:yes gene_type:complete
MSAMSDYLEQKLIDHLFDADNAGSYTPPTTYHIELFKVAVSEDGTGGTAVSGGSYARASIARGQATWTRSGNQVSNAGVVSFPVPSATWGTVVAFGVYDAASSGNLLLHGTLTTSKTINNGDPAPKFNAGELVFTFN